MSPGGIDLHLSIIPGPRTLSFILQWWTALWPQAYLETLDEYETFVWFDYASSLGEHPFNLVHVILDPGEVTLVVEPRDVHHARKCLDHLRSAAQPQAEYR